MPVAQTDNNEMPLATLYRNPVEAPGPLGLGDHLAHMRHRLVDRVYAAAAVLALLYVPLLAWRVAAVGWHRQLHVHAALIVITLLVAVLLQRLPLRLKSTLPVGSFLLLGLFGIFTMGKMGSGCWWCLQVAVMVAALISVRGGAALAVVLALGSYQATVAQLVEQVNRQRLQLQRRVGHDTLTGLPLLPLAADRLDKALKQARRSGQRVALLFVDLDGFKAVNDEHGHAAGDHVRQQVAARLRQALREEDTVARVGGDEFVLVLGHPADAQPAARLAGQPNATLAEAIEWQGRPLHMAASIGIAMFPDHAQDAHTLKRLADAAMYEVKKAGRNGYAFASPGPARR